MLDLVGVSDAIEYSTVWFEATKRTEESDDRTTIYQKFLWPESNKENVFRECSGLSRKSNLEFCEPKSNFGV